MLRSQINSWIADARQFFKIMNWNLPPIAKLTLHDWKEIMRNSALKEKYKEAIECGLGWDLSDFGSGNFEKTGLLLFTMRNGSPNSEKKYAEKIMIQRDGQTTPFHYHWSKMEDIINRGGGNLIIQLYNADSSDNPKPDDEWTPGVFADSDVEYSHDGVFEVVPAGTKIVLTPGESITLPARVYHSFTGEPKKGWVLVGEVSKVNDDNRDNRFQKELPRFSKIENDELPIHLLVNEYEKADAF